METATDKPNWRDGKTPEQLKDIEGKKEAKEQRAKAIAIEWTSKDLTARHEAWKRYDDQEKRYAWESMSPEEVERFLRAAQPPMRLLSSQKSGLIIGADRSDDAAHALTAKVNGLYTNFDWDFIVKNRDDTDPDRSVGAVLLRLDCASQYVRAGAHGGLTVPHLQISAVRTKFGNQKVDGTFVLDSQHIIEQCKQVELIDDAKNWLEGFLNRSEIFRAYKEVEKDKPADRVGTPIRIVLVADHKMVPRTGKGGIKNW